MPEQEGISFEEERQLSAARTPAQDKSIINWLIARGIAKNEKQANGVLIGVFVVVMLLVGYLLYTSFF